MNLSSETAVEQNRRATLRWIVIVVAVALLVATVMLYAVAWPSSRSWQWVPTVALFYLIPVTLAALYWTAPWDLATTWVSSASILILLVRGWQTSRSSAGLVGLFAVMVILPVWTYVLRSRGRHVSVQVQERTTSEQSHLLSAFNEIMRLGEPLPKMLQLVAQEISQQMGSHIALIGLVDRDPPLLYNEAVYGFSATATERLRQAKTTLSDVQDILRPEFAHDRCYVVPVDTPSPWMDALRIALSELESDIAGLFVVPLSGTEHDLGGILAWSLPRDQFPPHADVVQTAQLLGQQISVGLDRHKVYARLQRRVNSLVLINDIGQAITSGLEQESVLREVVHASIQLLNCEYCALYTWDRHLERLMPSVVHGFSVEQDVLLSSNLMDSLTQVLVRKGQPMLSYEELGEPTSESDAQIRLGSLLAVPLTETNRTSGVLLTASSQKHAFDQTDQILLSTLAEQASVAIQNARLYESTARRVSQLATLNDVGTAILSSLDVDVTLHQIMSNVQEAFDVESGSLLLERNGKLEFRVVFGPASDQIKSQALDMGQGIAGWVALTGVSVLVGEAQQDERHFDGMDEFTGYTTQSVLCVPLKGAGNEILGVIEIMNRRSGMPFNRQDQELLESIATFAVVAIQNAQLYAQTMSHMTDLSSLYEMGKSVTASLDIDDTLQIIVQETTKLTGAAKSRIVLLDSQWNRVTYVAQHGYRSAAPADLSYEEAYQGLSGWVLGEKTPTMSADLAQDERMRGLSVERAAGSDAQSMIIAPLFIKGETVGTLSAIRLSHTAPFSERELGLLNMMAGQAAVAIENAHFFAERKRQITELSILNQTSQALSSTLRPEDLMELIYSQVAQVMDAQSFYIALYDAEQELVYFPLAYENGKRQAGPDLEPVSTEWMPRRHRDGVTEYIIKTKEALWIPNKVQERLERLGIESIGDMPRSWMGVPVLAGDQVLGVIAVQNYEQENVYDHEHLDLLITIAGQASASIRNAQLFAAVNSMTENLEQLVGERTEALTVERDRLNVLYLIMRELSGSLEPERALSRTLVLINRALQAHQGYILLLDASSESLVYSAVMGETPFSTEGTPFPSPRPGDKVAYRSDSGLIGWMVSRQNLIRSNDLEKDTRWQIVPDQEQWHKSLLAAPLLTGHDVIGAIVLYHAENDHFTVDHERMLSAIASQVAIAVSNADMFRLLREAADRLGVMLRSQQLETARSQAILEGVADGVMVTDANGEITLFNAALERILDIPRVDVIGRSVSEMSGILSLAGTSWTELVSNWGQDETEPSPEEILYDERLELNERVVSVRVAPVRRQGAFEGTVSVFRDITKDVEVERMKSDFVSSVSHELRTPMTSIKGYIDLLYNGMAGPVSDEQRRFLDIVKANADRLTVLVNDLLDISRIDDGRLRLTMEAVDPLKIIDLVITNHAPVADKRRQKLENVSEGPLPLVTADPDRMTQILTNLVSNAIHYTPTGGSVTIDAHVEHGFLVLQVQDTGVGIKEEDQDKLFSRFFRADTPLIQARSGTGLGLSIVRSIVELHGGQIWFDSTFGAGSTFSFSLPLAEEAEAQVPETARKFKTISYRQQDKHILLVESDTAVAELISHQLRSRGGYRVHIEHSGREALARLLDNAYPTDLILFDLARADQNALYALQDILSHRVLAAIPVMALALSRKELHGNARAYVSRPVRSRRLLDAISAVFAEKATDLGNTRAKVLIAQEDRQLAELFTMVLTQKGLMVTLEHDADQVMHIAQTQQPDLILLDVKRKDVDGMKLLWRLKGDPRTSDLPVLLIAGAIVDDENGTEDDLDVSGFHLVDRPVEVDDLVGEIQQVLDEREKSQASSG